MTNLAQDRPIERVRDDRLNRTPFVENLARALVSDEKDESGRVVARHATGVVVGLTGKWGSGKSSIIHLLAEHLGAMDHVAVAIFNPWLFKGRDELLSAYFKELRDALGRSPQESAREAVAALERYSAAITASAHVVAVVAESVGWGWFGRLVLKGLEWLKLVKKPKDLSPQAERRELERKLADAKLAVVVLIDELDRVEDDDVRAVARLVKAVGDIKGVSYLVAYDPERVADALGRGEGEPRRRTGEAYLEKIIQHPIPLRPMFAHDVSRMLDALLEHHGLELPAGLTTDEIQILDCVRAAVETPRDVKRLVGAYAVLDRMLRQEVSAADLLGYCWLLTKAPTLRDALARNLDAFVDDPVDAEITRRVMERMEKREANLDTALGASPGPHADLLKRLFPRFGSGRERETGDRLSRRRNLVRTLYVGDAPGIASREDVERLWNEPDQAELTLELRRLVSSGELRPILDRLDDLLPKLPASRDVVFFCALSRALVRDHDWYLEPEPLFALADDATSHLTRLVLRDKAQAGRVRKIVTALLDDDDLVLSPAILRKHLFRWGLTHHEKGERSGEFIFDRPETEVLRDRAAPIYRAALLDGRLLRRIPNCEALFALSNADLWDEELRESLTAQLGTYEGRASFAALVTPPGHGVNLPTLQHLLDADAVRNRMRAAGEGREVKSWIDTCVRRLRRSLEGKDTIFDHGDDDDDDDDAAEQGA